MTRASTFTSFINAEVPANTAQQFAKLEDIANKTFDSIRRQAILTTRATAGLMGGGSSLAGGNAARQTAAAAAANTRLAQTSMVVTRSSAQTTAQMARQASAQERVDRSNNAMVRGLQATATTLNIVQGPLGPLAGRVTALSNAMERLTGVRLGVAAVGATLFALASAGNKAAEIRSKLAPLYETQEQINAAFARTAKIARDTRSELDPIVGLYSRLTMVGRDLNLNSMRIETTTRAAALGARISGGSGQAQSAALTQLAQGIGSDRLGGEELKSILENAPRIAKAIADGLSNTEKFGEVTLGTLRKLGAEGELTADRVTRALGRSLVQLEEEARRLGPSWTSATAAFSSELTVTVSKVDQVLGLTTSLATGLTFVADNMREIAALSLGVAAGWAAIKIAPRIAETALLLQKTADLHDTKRRDAVAEKARTAAAVQQYSRVVDAQQREKRGIQEKIQLLEKEQDARRRYAAKPTWAQASFAGGEEAARAQQTQRLIAVERRLDGERKRLRTTTAALGLTTEKLGQAKDRAATAATKAANASSLFRSAGSRLLGVINPLGIAVSIAATVMLELAFAESQAEKNAKMLESAQRTLAATIDETTGKIREQNAELRRGFVLQSKDAERLARQQDSSARIDAANEALKAMQTGTRRERLDGLAGADPRSRGSYRDVPVYAGGPGADRARQLLEGVRGGRIGATVAARELNELAKNNKALAAAADTITKQLPAVVEASRAVQTQVSYQREAMGLGSDEDRRRLRGDWSGGRPAGGKTLAQLDADAATLAQKLRNDRFAAANQRDQRLQDLADKRGKMDDAEYVQARAEILKSYDDEMGRIDKADAAGAKRAENERKRAEREEQRRLRAIERENEARERRTEKRNDILDRYQDEPKPIVKARDSIDELRRMVGETINQLDAAGNVIGQGFYTQEMADEDADRIMRGVRRPLEEVNREHQRELQIMGMILQGREDEAEALRVKFQLEDQIGEVTDEEYRRLVRNAAQQRQTNALLEQRERLVSNLMQSVEDVRDSLETLIMDFGRGPKDALKNFGRDLLNSYLRTQARGLVDRLMGGADQRVKDLINGRSKVDSAIAHISEGMNTAGTASEQLAATFEQVAARIAGAPTGTTNSVVPGGDAVAQGIVSTVTTAIGGRSSSSSFLDAMAGVMEDLKGEIVYEARRDGLGGGAGEGPIVVDGKRERGLKDLTDIVGKLADPQKTQKPATTREVFNAVGESVGGRIDEALGTKFFKGIGGKLGDALQGASSGLMVSQGLKSLGIKQSSTAAAIGGALGKASGIPGMEFVTAAVWGTIGGALKKAKKGTATIGGTDYGLDVVGTGGNSNKFKNAATGSADNIIGSVLRIAESLGGGIDASRGRVSIGIRDGKYRVDPSGSGHTKKKYGAVDFGEDESAAITYAIKNLIQDGVITGISQASQNILRAGRDLEVAISKAAVIESIPRRLMALTDPVRFAVTELNREFVQMISYLKEGGANAQQFADAQKLYDLERARAIEAARQQATGAIQQFIDDMTAGSNSPLNKRTVYGNAKTNIDKFVTDVNSGKSVDQSALLDAARNFQDASRELHGSGQSFFDDFNFLFQLLSKARDNAGLSGGNIAELPPSPFAQDPAVQNAINGATGAINNQTGVLQGELAAIRDLLGKMGGGGGGSAGGGSSIGALPGFGGGTPRIERGQVNYA